MASSNPLWFVFNDFLCSVTEAQKQAEIKKQNRWYRKLYCWIKGKYEKTLGTITKTR